MPKRNVNNGALDASAILAVVFDEPGAPLAQAAIESGATAISAVNMSEVIARMLLRGMPAEEIRLTLEDLSLDVHPFDAAAAYSAAALAPVTRVIGLSFGDRACLALAASLHVPAITADRAWARAPLGVEVILIR